MLSHTLPSQSLQMPSLLQSIQQLVLKAQPAMLPRKPSGLSFFDIEEASMRATEKNALKVRPNPNQALRSV